MASSSWLLGARLGAPSFLQLRRLLCSAGFSVPSGLVVVSSGVGCRRFKVGLPGAPSSAPGSAPVADARAFESRSRRDFTRWNSEELITYSSCSGNRAASAKAEARRSGGAGMRRKSSRNQPGFFLFLASSFSNIVAIALGS